MTQDKLKPCKCHLCQVWDDQLKNIPSLTKPLNDIAKNEEINKKDNQMQDNKTTLELGYLNYIDTAGGFWLVWTPQGGHPKYKHSTRELAEMESARLAKQHPDREFYVLKPVSKVNVEFVVHRTSYE